MNKDQELENLLSGGEDLPAAKGFIRIHDEEHELGVVNEYPALTAINMLIDIAIGRGFQRVAKMIDMQNKGEGAGDPAAPLAKLQLSYFAQNSHTGREISLAPPAVVVSALGDLIQQRNEVLAAVGIRLEKLAAISSLTLYVWGSEGGEQEEEGGEEEVGDLEEAMARAHSEQMYEPGSEEPRP